MKNLSTLFALALVLGLFSMAFRPAELVTYQVDVEKSLVNWKGHKVTGFHEGNVNIKSGNLSFSGNTLTGGSFEIDMASITCTDLDPKYGDKLVGHLKSEDFFGVKKYPVAVFEIAKATPQGPGRYKILGELTIKDITHPIRFNAEISNQNGVVEANAEVKIDRSDYNVRYSSSSFFSDLGDKTIYDEFDMNIKLVASK